MRIGLLSSAHMHVQAYVQGLQLFPEVELVGLYDDNSERGRAFAEKAHLPWHADLVALLSQVDATIICSENAKHRFYVEQSAAAGLSVLCEKPLATTLDDALFMLEAMKSAGVPLYLALPVRFTPGFSPLLDAVRQGHVGRVLAMVGTNHGYLPPGWFLDSAQAGGGAVMDHTPHVVDLMRLIAHSEVEEVFAEMDSRVHQAGIDDCGILTLTFQNGAFATLDPSWSRTSGFPTPVDVTLEVVGTKGVIDFDAFRSHLDLYQSRDPNHQHVGFGESMDARLIGAFISSLTDKSPHPLLARGIDGLRALEVALAAYRSHKSQQSVPIEHLL